VTEGDLEAAMEAYSVAMDLVPDEATDGEAPFWVGVTLAASDRTEEALPYLRRAYAQDANWAELLLRLPAAELLPSMELARELAEAMRGGRP
jgi:tetratricopeptide (TPR) repeat protein